MVSGGRGVLVAKTKGTAVSSSCGVGVAALKLAASRGEVFADVLAPITVGVLAFGVDYDRSRLNPRCVRRSFIRLRFSWAKSSLPRSSHRARFSIFGAVVAVQRL